MTPLDPRPDDGPDLVPPPELLRLRGLLMRPPAPSTRAQHLAATTIASRQRSIVGPMGRFASRGARLAVGVVATLAITSGLAGAQLLPETAQRLFSTVTDRFAPPSAPSTTTTTDEPDGASPRVADRSGTSGPAVAPGDDVTATTGTTGVAPPTTSGAPAAPVTTTTLLGPIGPGSPDDPTDPGTTTTTEPEPTTTTTEPEPTTTTTQPGSSTTSSSSTTSTTAPPR